MTVKEFIAGYNHAKDKDTYPSKHVKTKYITYQEKIARCKVIIDNTMYIKISDKTIFKINSPLQYVNFCTTLIDLYFDIDITYGAGFLDDFNALNEIGLIDILIANIPEREYTEFNTILHMMVDDVMENERNLVGYIETKIDAIGMMVNGLQEAISEQTPTE